MRPAILPGGNAHVCWWLSRCLKLDRADQIFRWQVVQIFLWPLKKNWESNALRWIEKPVRLRMERLWFKRQIRDEREVTISDDALSQTCAVTRDMACRESKDKTKKGLGQEIERGMVNQGKPQRRTNNCRFGPENQNTTLLICQLAKIPSREIRCRLLFDRKAQLQAIDLFYWSDTLRLR